MRRLLFLFIIITAFFHKAFPQLQRVDSTLLETVDSAKIVVGQIYSLNLNPKDSYLSFANPKYPIVKIARDSCVLLLSLLKDALNDDNYTKKRDFECEAPNYKVFLYSGGKLSYSKTIWTEREVVYFSDQLISFLNQVSMIAYNQENSIKRYYGWSMHNTTVITREYCKMLSSSLDNYQNILDSIEQTTYRSINIGYTRKICFVYALSIYRKTQSREQQMIISDFIEKIGIPQDSILSYSKFLDNDLQKELIRD